MIIKSRQPSAISSSQLSNTHFSSTCVGLNLSLNIINIFYTVYNFWLIHTITIVSVVNVEKYRNNSVSETGHTLALKMKTSPIRRLSSHSDNSTTTYWEVCNVKRSINLDNAKTCQTTSEWLGYDKLMMTPC